MLEWKSAPILFDYFEQCMIAATFSYQSLETFSNQIIDESLRDGKTLSLERKKATVSFDAASLQRDVSTEEKIATVLPKLRGIAFPRSGKLWQEFTILRRVRDTIVHLKSGDHIVRGAVDRETVFYRLLNNSPRKYPRAAIDVMRHFTGGQPLEWLDYADQRLKEAGKPNAA